jgi:HlyD family secretion protein
MKRISRYIILIVAIGCLISGYWVYSTYFRKESERIYTYTVEKGKIQEKIRARGEVLSKNEIELGFPFGGIIDEIYYSEGDEIREGNEIIKLDTIEFRAEKQRLQAIRDQYEATLAKLLAGATKEDLQVTESRVLGAKIALSDARQGLINSLRDAYSSSDNVIRNSTDELFSNARGANPKLVFVSSDPQLVQIVEFERLTIEGMLTKWQFSLDGINDASDLNAHVTASETNLNKIRIFLNELAELVNYAHENQIITDATIDAWKLAVSGARTANATARSGVVSANEKVRSAEISLKIVNDELAYKKAGPRPEDIAIAKSNVAQVNSQIQSIDDKIRKSSIYSPADGNITKIVPGKREIYPAGTTAVSISTNGFKLSADISELDIGDIGTGDGTTVTIKMDAFPSSEFKGNVVSIEPKEIIKDGDVYYRVNIYFEDSKNQNIRPGMSADLTIFGNAKNDILKIPEIAVYSKGGKKYVEIQNGKNKSEVEVVTGISDGENIEIISGITEGQIVAVPNQ